MLKKTCQNSDLSTLNVSSYADESIQYQPQSIYMENGKGIGNGVWKIGISCALNTKELLILGTDMSDGH